MIAATFHVCLAVNPAGNLETSQEFKACSVDENQGHQQGNADYHEKWHKHEAGHAYAKFLTLHLDHW